MKKLSLCILLGVIIAFCSTPVLAMGFGVYGSAGGGSADWSDFNDTDFRKNTTHAGIGLVMDTAPGRSKLYNYQLNLGYDYFLHQNSSAWGRTAFNGFVISNSFGFGTLVNSTTRVWVGPELRIEIADGSPSNYSDYKIHLFGVGFGPVVGVNFNYDESRTFALKVGAQYMRYGGTGKGKYSHFANSNTTYTNYYDYDVTERMVYVMLQYLFRTAVDR